MNIRIARGVMGPMVDRGPISNRANRGRRALIVVFTLHLALGLVCTLTVSRPVLARMLDGVWPSKDELPALVPLAFVLVGLIGLLHTVRKARSKEQGGAGPAVGPAEYASGPVTLRPLWSPLGKVVGTVVLAVFWNGIVSVFVYEAVTHRGDAFYFAMGLFMIPFVLIGLLLVGFVFYQVLALFNPRPLLHVASARAALGASVPVEWELEGAVHRLRSLKVLLEGREEATYRQGTSTRTDKNVFCTITVHDSGETGAIDRGRTTIEVPRDSMHSWAADHNKVIWALKVKGEIAWWPDVDDEFPFTVLPLPPFAQDRP